MAYSLTIVVKLLPADVGLAATLVAKIYNSSNVLRVTTSAGVGWTELGGGEYQFTYASYDTTDAYVAFYNGATYETSGSVAPPAISDLTGIATTQDIADAVGAIELHGDANWDTATGFATPTNVSDAVTSINSHTDVNLDAKVSTRAITSDITTAVTSINNHTDINLDAKVSTRAIPSDVTTAVTNINNHTDINLDAKVSTRLATTGYTAPDNATIGTTGSTVATNLDAKITSRASATDMATVLADLVAIQATLDSIDLTDVVAIQAQLDKVIKKLDAQINN